MNGNAAATLTFAAVSTAVSMVTSVAKEVHAVANHQKAAVGIPCVAQMEQTAVQIKNAVARPDIHVAPEVTGVAPSKRNAAAITAAPVTCCAVRTPLGAIRRGFVAVATDWRAWKPRSAVGWNAVGTGSNALMAVVMK